MTAELIIKIGQQLLTVAQLIHGDDAAKVKEAVQKLIAAAVADLPDGSQITEAELVAHCDQVIADAAARRQRINQD